jgi:glycine/D-amino acid oxidase-like deaminating enzyme
MRVVVIGAGVVGSSLAFRLAQAGADVTVVDRSGPAHGTTSSTFSWINASSKTPEDYFRLNHAGMHAHWELRDELGAAPWLHEGGNLVWVAGDEQAAELESRVARVRSWGYQAEWIDRQYMQTLEPPVRFEPEVEQGVLFHDEAWIDGPVLASRMCELAAQHGARMMFPSEVAGMMRDQGRISGVVLANGEQLSADLVVNCAGPQADRVAQLAGRRLPLAPTLGLIVRISGGDGCIQRVMHAPRLHMRPDGNGLVMLHHGDADAAIERGEPARAWVDELLERARAYVAGFDSIRLSRWAVVTRPIPQDERTTAGLVASLPGYAEIVTHSGITLGPLLARLVAHEIMQGETDPLLAAFRPDRWG